MSGCGSKSYGGKLAAVGGGLWLLSSLVAGLFCAVLQQVQLPSSALGWGGSTSGNTCCFLTWRSSITVCNDRESCVVPNFSNQPSGLTFLNS